MSLEEKILSRVVVSINRQEDCHHFIVDDHQMMLIEPPQLTSPPAGWSGTRAHGRPGGAGPNSRDLEKSRCSSDDNHPAVLGQIIHLTMVVKIRLARFGRRKAPFYNIVVAQARYGLPTPFNAFGLVIALLILPQDSEE